MNIKKIGNADLETVKHITAETINSIYPHYYPCGAVCFFLNHHNDQSIMSDIENGNVYLCLDKGNQAIGTVTVKNNEICRLFVLPQYQGKGYGGELLRFAEQKIAESHKRIILDASLPAKAIYLKKGYVPSEFHSVRTENGDYLCYDVMVKRV